MVDKVNGKSLAGEFLGKQLDFYSLAFTADLNTVAAVIPAVDANADGDAVDPAEIATQVAAQATENARAAAAFKRRERIIETISINGQPIIIGTFSDSTSGAQTFKFALEHSASWQDGETVLVADKAAASLDEALELVPGVTAVTVTKTKSL